jgi:hypothetical protein
MQKTIEALNRFRNQRQRDKGHLWLVGCLSLAIALVAELLAKTRVMQAFFDSDHGSARAWVYVVIAYFVLVPVSLFFQKTSLQSFSPRPGPLSDRIFMLVLGASLWAPGFFLPEAMLAFGAETTGRSSLAYRAMINTIPGLAVTGAFLFYGAAACVWMLSGAIRHVGAGPPPRGDVG